VVNQGTDTIKTSVADHGMRPTFANVENFTFHRGWETGASPGNKPGQHDSPGVAGRRHA